MATGVADAGCGTGSKAGNTVSTASTGVHVHSAAASMQGAGSPSWRVACRASLGRVVLLHDVMELITAFLLLPCIWAGRRAAPVAACRAGPQVRTAVFHKSHAMQALLLQT
jgi:hypothetical protein